MMVREIKVAFDALKKVRDTVLFQIALKPRNFAI